MNVELRPLAPRDQAVCLEAHEELVSDGFDFLWGFEPPMSWDEYLTMLADYAVGRNLAPDHVASVLLLALVEGEVVGRVSVRFALNDFLLARGGHIGYAVRPRFRRRGYATLMLTEALALAHRHGIDPVLVTCNDANVASAGVIERYAGVLESVFVDHDGTRIRRYWIRH